MTLTLQIILTIGAMIVSITASFFMVKGRVDLLEMRSKDNEKIFECILKELKELRKDVTDFNTSLKICQSKRDTHK